MLSEFEIKAWEFYQPDITGPFKVGDSLYIKAVHTLNLLLSRQIKESDFAFNEPSFDLTKKCEYKGDKDGHEQWGVANEYKAYQQRKDNHVPLFEGEWEHKAGSIYYDHKTDTKVVIPDTWTVQDCLDHRLTLNPNHPDLPKDFKEIMEL